MAYQQLQLVCDSSTLANFKAWAKPISDWFRSAGFVDNGDTGQLNAAGNGGWASVAAVPGSAAFYYEVFRSNDGYTQFLVKVEYGNVTGTNCPSLRISISTASNGSGTLNGPWVLGPVNTNQSSFTPPSTTNQYECNFTRVNAESLIAIMMWRNGTGNCQQLFAIERSKDSSGNPTNAYVTLWTIGYYASTVRANQITYVFGVGIAPWNLSNSMGFLARVLYNNGSSVAFNNGIPFDTCSPCVGFFDNPSTAIGLAPYTELTEGVSFAVTIYGSARTYIPTRNGPFTYVQNPGSGSGIAFLCMRYD